MARSRRWAYFSGAMSPSVHHDSSTVTAVIPAEDGVVLDGTLEMPVHATGVVLFAHGSGSSRHSPRNVQVAQVLHAAGVGTLLFDLLSETEGSADDYNRELRSDIPLLARRLRAATAWLRGQAGMPGRRFGYFGASTGAAAALIAASEEPDIAAVVSRGGRPDLAAESLARVKAPTLLIVGGNDGPVLELNFAAASQLRCQHRVEIVPGASHLFEEPGTLDLAAEMAAAWFTAQLK